MNKIFNILLLIILSSALLLSSNAVSSFIATIFIVLSYTLFLVVVLSNNCQPSDWVLIIKRQPRIIELCITILVSLWIMNVLFGRYETNRNAFSALVMVCIFLINIYVIPAFVDVDDIFYLLSRLSVILVAIPLITLPLTLISERIMVYFWWGGGWRLDIIGGEFPFLTSLVYNPNLLGIILFIGAVSTIGLLRSSHQPLEKRVFIFILFGIFLTGSRGAWLAMGGAIFIYSVYWIRGEKELKLAIVVSYIIVFLGFVILVATYNPSISFTLSGRRPIWVGTIEAISKQPLTGYGFGSTAEFISEYIPGSRYTNFSSHNGFLTVVLRVGVSGGIAYLILFIGSIFLQIKREKPNIPLIMIVFGFGLIKTFDGTIAISYSISSILLAISIGYLLNDGDKSTKASHSTGRTE